MYIVLRFSDDQPDTTIDLGDVSRKKAMQIGGEIYVNGDNVDNYKVVTAEGQDTYHQNYWKHTK